MITHEIQPLIWRFADYELDELRRELRQRGDRVALEAKLFDLLAVLVAHAGEVVTRIELCESVWPGIQQADPSLNTAISKLRGALAEGERLILTVPGVGYKFVHAVTTVAVGPVVTQAAALQEGGSVPGREQWKLKKMLSVSPGSAVWFCSHRKTSEVRVFKFAFDGPRLLRLQREVAVSRLLAMQGAQSEFVRVLEWNFVTAPYFLESEYGGVNLFDYAEAKGGLVGIPLDERLQLLAQVARAVAVAHNLGVIHKDLKPTNVLVSEAESGPPAVKVSDFDLAWLMEPMRLASLEITNPGFGNGGNEESSFPAGTVLYVAPEVLRGSLPSMASDGYALGVILYQLVTGDFRNKLSAGWEAEVEDPLIREDIAAAASGTPEQRPSASALAQRLETLTQRRVEREAIVAARARTEAAERQVAKTRARRPWVMATVAALAVGLVVSLIMFQRASREVRRQSALNRFVSRDILARDNPYLSGSAHESLEEAIARSSPAIDQEFKDDPDLAAHLHLELASALDARTHYESSRQQYECAIQLFKEVGGAESQDALYAEFREAALLARSFLPGTLDAARSMYKQAESAMALVRHPQADVEIWQHVARGAIAVIEVNPKLAVSNFSAAIQMAEASPGFDAGTLRIFKGFLASAYLRLPDGPGAERICREVIQETRPEDRHSIFTLKLRAVLAQSLFVSGKYQAAIQEADAIYPELAARLGADHEICMQLLSSRSAAAGHLGLWDRAIEDDLAIYKLLVKKQGPASMLAVATLSDAGLSQCRAVRYGEGEANTRMAFEHSKKFPRKVGLTDATSYSLAYCLTRENKLDEASALLRDINVEAVTHLTGEPSVAGDVALARADVAFRRHDYKLAEHYADLVSQAFSSGKVDELDKQELAELRKKLHKHHS